MREIEAEAHTNTFYKHFYYFVRCQSCHYHEASDWSQHSDTRLSLAAHDDNDNNAREHNMLEEKDYAPLEALTARICTD